MVPAHVLLAFVPACVALVAIPGPAVGYVVVASLRHGRRGGVAATLGIEAGNLVLAVAAALGLSAVMAASATVFTVVKVAGAAWLLWLAVRSWRARTPGTVAELGRTGAADVAGARAADDPAAERAARAARPSRLWLGGLLVGSLNPKTALFFLAFLPQFVTPGTGAVTTQLLVLGAVFCTVATAGDLVWALAGAELRRWLPRVRMRVLDRVSAGVYAALGVVALTARRAV